MAHSAKKKKLQRNMTKDYYWMGAAENIGMFSNLRNVRKNFIYLYLFEPQVRPLFNKLSFPSDDWELFCEPASTCQLTASGFCNNRKSTSKYAQFCSNI